LQKSINLLLIFRLAWHIVRASYRLTFRKIDGGSFGMEASAQPPNAPNEPKRLLVRGLSLLDATMIVMGSMIGSGIFLVSAESARLVASPGWLLAAWALAGVLTITGALSCAELAAMMPRAGGQYVFLREAYGPSIGFLFGWTLFLVVQTGTIAAVAVAFANFMGVLIPAISGDNYLIAPRALGRLRHWPFN
jgi:APA family basic amino acid/polyamine antiporter